MEASSARGESTCDRVPGPASRVPLRRLTLPGARADRLYFAQVREDPLLEIEALRPTAGDTVVVIGSGGCTALSLLAAGAGRVVAVDLNTTQNHLIELKLAAVAALPRDDGLRFLGGEPTGGAERAAAYRALRGRLTEPARRFWDAHPGLVRRGVLGAGVSERFIALVVGVLRTLVHPRRRIARLLASTTLAEQRAFYEREWDTWRWRALFAVLLNRWAFRRVYDPAFFAHVERRSFAEHFHRMAEHGLAEVPVASNYFLHHMLTGRYPAGVPGGVPPYLSEVGAARVGSRAHALTVVDGPVTEYLRGCPTGSVNAFALSNVCEWLAPNEVDALFAEVARTAAPGARVVFRNFVGWTEVPPRWRDVIVEDRPTGERLIRHDRSLLQCRVAVCRVRGAGEGA